MDEDSRPRARTVFEAVQARRGGDSSKEVAPVPIVKRPTSPRWELLKSAANRELDRFAALTGVLATHFVTNAMLWPVLGVSLKVVVSAVLLGTNSLSHFTWLQAMILSGGLWIAGPLCFFLYRYWSGKF